MLPANDCGSNPARRINSLSAARNGLRPAACTADGCRIEQGPKPGCRLEPQKAGAQGALGEKSHASFLRKKHCAGRYTVIMGVYVKQYSFQQYPVRYTGKI